MDFEQVQEELPKLVGTLLDLPCEWRAQPRKYRAGPLATLDVLGIQALGVDNLSWANVEIGPDEDPEVSGVQATVTGQRELTLQVSVWSESQPLHKSARFFLERLRTRLRLPTSLEALRALALAHVNSEPIVNGDVVEDGRLRSFATMDIRFGFASEELDAEIPFIESFRLQTTFRNAAGEPLPAGLQIDEIFDGVP